jgi:hypothetical protein
LKWVGEPFNTLPKSLDHEYKTPRKQVKYFAILKKAPIF